MNYIQQHIYSNFTFPSPSPGPTDVSEAELQTLARHYVPGPFYRPLQLPQVPRRHQDPGERGGGRGVLGATQTFLS